MVFEAEKQEYMMKYQMLDALHTFKNENVEF